MNETHEDALLLRPEPGVHDGCYLITKPRCPVGVAALNARLEALPAEPEWFKVITARMADIQDVPRPSVIE